METNAVSGQVYTGAEERRGGLYSFGGQSEPPRQARATKGHAGAGISYRRAMPNSGLDLELLGHRHFGRAVHRVTLYVPPFLDARKAFLPTVASLDCPTKQ